MRFLSAVGFVVMRAGMVAYRTAEGKAGGYAFSSSFRGAPLGANPESISPCCLLYDGFSVAQLRNAIVHCFARWGQIDF
ncbi:hypothetical protein [Bradyrhizobium sp. 23AC]